MPVGEELLVRRRPLLGAEELPPARPFVLPEPALMARGEDLPEARAEECQIVGGEVGGRREQQQDVPQHGTGIARRERKARRYHEWGFVVLSEFQPRRRHEVIRHLAPVKRRDAAHGVDHVLVEAWEEPEPMLAGHAVLERMPGATGELISAGVLALVDDGNAAGLASRNIAALEHHDLEAALD